MRERTFQGPKGQGQFFLSQNGQFEDFILLKTLFLLLTKSIVSAVGLNNC